MEFIEYLDKVEIEIIKDVEKAGYSLEENNDICLLSNKFKGFFNKRRKTIVICTDNAKAIEGYTILRRTNNDYHERTARHIKKAVRHEAVHVAQECNNGKPLEIKQKLKMNPAKTTALNGSIKLSGDKEKERQAYILEDRPKLIAKELKKYCL